MRLRMRPWNPSGPDGEAQVEAGELEEGVVDVGLHEVGDRVARELTGRRRRPSLMFAPTVGFCVADALRVGRRTAREQQQRRLRAIEAVVGRRGRSAPRAAARGCACGRCGRFRCASVTRFVACDVELGRLAVGDRLGRDERDVVDVRRPRSKSPRMKGMLKRPSVGRTSPASVRLGQRAAHVQQDVDVDLGREVVLRRRSPRRRCAR